MGNFFIQQLDYIYFIYGLSFIILSGVCFVLSRLQKNKLCWIWLGLFGLIHGLNKFLELVSLFINESRIIKILSLVFLVVSFTFLLKFVFCSTGKIKEKKINDIFWLVPFGFLLLFGYSRAGIEGISFFARFFGGVIGGVLCSYVFFLIVNKSEKKLEFYFLITSILMFFYALTQLVVTKSSFLWASVINTESFLSWSGIPIVLVRAVLTLLISLVFWLYWNRSEAINYWKESKIVSKRFIVNIVSFFLILIIGWAITNKWGEHYIKDFRSDLVDKTKTAAAAINFRRISHLTGTMADLTSADYARLMEQMQAIYESCEDVKRVYLLGVKKEDSFFYFINYQVVDNIEKAEPGVLFGKNNFGLLEILNLGVSFVRGPIIDKQGVWFKAFAPVRNLDTGKVSAVLGLDNNAAHFYRDFYSARFIGIVITASFFILFFSFIIILEFNKSTTALVKVSEKQLNSMFKTAPEGVFIFDIKTRQILDINPFLVKLLNYSRNEMLNFIVDDLTKAGSVWIEEIVRESVEKRTFFIKDIEYLKKNGDLIDVEITGGELQYQSRECAFVFVRDVSERKQAELQLKNSYRQVLDILDFLPDATFVVDKFGKVIFWNKAIEKLTGTVKEDIVGKGDYAYAIPFYGYARPVLIDMIFKSDAEIKEKYKSVIKKESSIYGEVFVKTLNNGKGAHLAGIASGLFNEQGELIGSIESLRDFTEKKLIDDKIKTLSYAVEQSPSTVVLTDVKGIIQYVNPKFVHITGYEGNEVIGKNPSILKSGELKSEEYANLWETIIAGREWRGEFHNKRKNGELYWEYASISAIKDQEGNVVHYLKVSEDITERKRIEQLKNDFISTVSHELRTPLTAIKEGIGIVLDGSAGSVNEEQKDFLDTAKRNVDRLARLINDVLDLQKLQAGRTELSCKDENIAELINEVKVTMQPLTKNKGLELNAECQSDIKLVSLDKDKITQVLINLVNNAIKFTEKGKITILVSKEFDNMIQIGVTDTGIGISPQDIDKLFKTFVQVAPEPYRKTGSTGLGLAISKEIIRLHGGKIWVKSEVGKGSTFYFVLPLTDRRKKVRI